MLYFETKSTQIPDEPFFSNFPKELLLPFIMLFQVLALGFKKYLVSQHMAVFFMQE